MIRKDPVDEEARLEYFLATMDRLRAQPTWDKPELVDLFNHMIPKFQPEDTASTLIAGYNMQRLLDILLSGLALLVLSPLLEPIALSCA